MTMTDDELRKWQRDRAAKFEPAEGGLGKVSFSAHRSMFSLDPPSDYACRACGERVAYGMVAEGPRVHLWRRDECLCERERREGSEAASLTVSDEAVRNRRAIDARRREEILGFSPARRAIRFGVGKAGSEQMEDATRVLRHWCERQVAGERQARGWIVTSTDVGCGKTYLLTQCANALVDGGVATAMYSLATLLDAIRAEQRGDAVTMRLACRVPVLILDDIGAPAVQTSWQADTLYTILDRRYTAGLPLLASSNILDERSKARSFSSLLLAPRPDEFPDRIVTANRIASRLTALARALSVMGPDLRNNRSAL